MKCKPIGLMLILILSFAGKASTAVVGDINGDGKIDLTEALYALQVAAGMYPHLEPSCLLVGKGAWAGGTIYTPCDVVTHENSTYACLAEHRSSDFELDRSNWVQLSQEAPIKTVTSANGRVWMDRNIGALRVATKTDDPDAYGSLYQWGRHGDGHEYRSSSTTSTVSTTDSPYHGSLILSNSSYYYDWITPRNNNLWQGVSGINNPCPPGFRLPTEEEWDAERLSWSPNNNSTGAYNSPLKLTVAGYRNLGEGKLTLTGFNGYYWSSTVDGGTSNSRSVHFNSGNAYMFSNSRAVGFSVRCIKD